jgi:SAM-dependent methyltransferase
MADVAEGYDRVADAYARHFFHELDAKPLDRALLDAFAEETRGRGPVADLGCGPGHVGRYLRARGVDAFGLDLSSKMVAAARRLAPEVPCEVGSMLALPREDGALDGATAFYAIVNLAHDDVRRAFVEIARVLAPGAPLLFSFHLGDERRHLDQLLDVETSLDFYFFRRDFIEDALTAARLETVMWMERRAHAKEHPSTRAYVLARRGPVHAASPRAP